MISKLLVKDVNTRYSATEAYNHPWIQNVEQGISAEIAEEAFENMRKFVQAMKFKKATLIFLASKIPEKNIEEMRKLFIHMDVDGDGKITHDEFQRALKTYGLNFTPEEIE